ncbi:MAG: transglutaminase domain-containing protein [Pseudomonadota bacterium]
MEPAAPGSQDRLRGLRTIALLLWGVQVDWLVLAIPMAVLLELPGWWQRRWTLTRKDFYRVSDATAIAFALMVIFLLVNNREYHFMHTLLGWLPILMFPLVLAFAYSTSQRMPLDVLFYSLRRGVEKITQSWDIQMIYFGLCLVSAGANPAGDQYYFLIMAALIVVAMLGLRSRRYTLQVWLLAVCIGVLAATAVHHTLRGTHLALKAQTQAWLLEFVRQRADPLRTRTRIGSLGDIKASDTILLRLDVAKGHPPAYLHEASYDYFDPTTSAWMIGSPGYVTLEHRDDFAWQLSTTPGENGARVHFEFEQKNALIPLPPGTTDISDLPAQELKLSQFFSVQGQDLVRGPGYNIEYTTQPQHSAAPGDTDLVVNRELQQAVDSVLAGTDPILPPISRIRQALDGYRYSLHQDEVVDLATFLESTRAGHCEYFATATVMMLRRMGIPARYSVGYSVQEYSPWMGSHVVRHRHAHAWATAFIDGQWHIVDTTPAVWVEQEAAQASFLSPIRDTFSNLMFAFQRWWRGQSVEDYQLGLYAIVALLTALLVWRLTRNESVLLADKWVSEDASGTGRTSPLTPVLKDLEQRLPRRKGELLPLWLLRIEAQPLSPAVPHHYALLYGPSADNQSLIVRLDQIIDEWHHAQATGDD